MIVQEEGDGKGSQLVLPARTYVQCKLDMSGNTDGMRVNKYTIAMDVKVGRV